MTKVSDIELRINPQKPSQSFHALTMANNYQLAHTILFILMKSEIPG